MAVRVDHPFFGKRLAGSFVFSLIFFSVLVLRLWYLQCINGGYYRDQSENNRTRTVRTIAPRGTFYDRENRIVVKNRPSFSVALMREDVQDLDYTIAELARLTGPITGRTEESLRKQLNSTQKHRHFEPQEIIPDATFEELARIRANSYRLPGVIVEVAPTRSYPFSTMASQLFGYVREISKAQLDESALRTAQYRPGDLIGQSGVERTFESYLQGTSGYVQVEVDAMGNRKSELGIVDSSPGNDVQLTIDLDLQRIAEEALEGKRGAVVVLDPKSGEVLALASAPSFDANVFSGAMLAEEWQKISQNKDHPLRNRAIGEVYPAGSTFKLILTVAALAEKKITPSTVLNCPGYYMFAGRPYRCHKRTGHGAVDLKHALAVSCNAYYYQVGQMLGIDTINRYAEMLGLGTVTGIDIPGEKQGVVPSTTWKLKALGERWYPGETVSASIGQGYVAITPLQMAVAAATIANGGTVYRPHVVRQIVNPASGKTIDFSPEVLRRLPVGESVWPQVRDLASGVVNLKEGTGTKAALPGILVAGKTGTAQVAALGKDSNPDLNDHAWFVAFAPKDDAKIALAIIVENGGHGGSTSAPIARLIFEKFFRKLGMLPPEPIVEPTGDGAGTPEDESSESVEIPAQEAHLDAPVGDASVSGAADGAGTVTATRGETG